MKKSEIARIISNNCQCDSSELVLSQNKDTKVFETLLYMPIDDSDCEFYFEDYNIQQENGFNIVNISKLIESGVF